MVDIFGGVKWLAGFPFLAADSLADFQASFELGDLCRADAFNQTDFARRSIVDAFEAAELI